MSTPKPIVVKNDEASTVFAWRGPMNDDGSPAAVLPGVPARDLTEFDLAALTPNDRLSIQLESKRKGGAYEKVGKIPAGLVIGAEPDVSDEVPPVQDEPPAPPATGKKE